MTLKELIEKHGFGVWLAHKHFPNVKDFRPVCKSNMLKNIVIGEYYDGKSSEYFENYENFVLYEPTKQKKKVKLYRYLFEEQDGDYGKTIWTSKSFNKIKENSIYERSVLISTEEKEVEVSE